MKKRKAVFLWVVFLLFSLLFGCKESAVSNNAEDAPPELLAPLPPAGTSPPLSNEPPEEESPQEEEPLPAETQNEYAPYIAACAAANVNVREGAGTNAPILFTLKKGASLPFLERKENWFAVKTESGVGYLYGEYAYLAETCLALENMIRAGLQKTGTPYEWGAPRVLTDKGGENPYFSGRSFDCSSFVQYCFYVGCGIKLGNYTGSQADHTVGEKIASYAGLKRGDFYFTGTGRISHVVIYLGGGYLLQTYSANGGPVSVTTDDRWKTKFLSGRRPDLSVTDQYE